MSYRQEQLIYAPADDPRNKRMLQKVIEKCEVNVSRRIDIDSLVLAAHITDHERATARKEAAGPGFGLQ